MKNKLLSLLLISVLFSVTSYGQKLFKAVEDGRTNRVEKLLKNGEDLNAYAENGLFPLWRAAANNDYEVAVLLLENGANANQATKVPPLNSTSIAVPLQEGYLKMVKLLVEHGADVNLQGFRNFTPIRIAAQNGHLEIVKYLAEQGADIDFKAMDGATPLEHAASKGHLDVVAYLVESGANVDNVDAEGDFPLGEAAKKGYTAIIEVLIGAGADLQLKDSLNRTAVEIAEAEGQTEAAAVIRKHLEKKA